MSRTQPGHRGPPILCGNEVVAKPQCVAHLPLEVTQMWHPCRTVATGIRSAPISRAQTFPIFTRMHCQRLGEWITSRKLQGSSAIAVPNSSNALRGYDLWPMPLPLARASCTVVSNKHFNTSGSSASSRRWHQRPPSWVIRTFVDECSPRTWCYMVLESSWIPMIPDDSWWNPHILPR